MMIKIIYIDKNNYFLYMYKDVYSFLNLNKYRLTNTYHKKTF